MEIQAQVKLQGAVRIASIDEIGPGDRLFYHLGHYSAVSVGRTHLVQKSTDWVRDGIYKEIEDVPEYLKKDTRLSDPAFIRHHDFVIIKQKI